MANKSTAFAKNLSMLNIVGLRESIDDLLSKEGKYAPVASVCKAYLKKLDEGMHEEQICSNFITDLTRVAIHESAKDVVFSLGKKLDEHKRDIDIVNNLYEMQNSQYTYVVPMVESVLVGYMTDKNAETRTAARQSLSLFEGIKQVNSILEDLSFDEYEEKTNQPLYNSSLNEAMLPKDEKKTYTQEEVDEMLKIEKQNAINESNSRISKHVSDIDSHINLDGTIKAILVKESKNEGLKAYCEQYIQALNAGKSEELLYESFISGASRWNHLSAVDTELSALGERVAKYKQEVDLKKILRIMESTGSYYIVPLIEGCVADYIENKTMANKAILKQRLQAFEYDPFVRDILNVVMNDQSLEANVYLGESLEKVNSLVHTEKVFSPVKYVKENECIFNVKGTYYNRKGNTITKLSKSSIENLDESFKMLCNLINHPAVEIDDLSNSISIYEGKDSAKITESAIIVNGEEVTPAELENIANMSHLMNEHKEGFYAAIKMINEKFDEIANIDFVKRVAMNESNGKTVDVFRIKNNLFVATSDSALGSSTFYRNVNPIQCRSYINEHMSINVSSMFEDILPNQHAILEGIEEAKKEYETYIEDLKKKKEEFEAMKDSTDESADGDIDKAIKLIDDELADVEKDYEKYKKDSEKYVEGDPDDADSSDNDTTTDTDTDTTDETPADASTGEEEPTETPAEMETPIDATSQDSDIAAFDAQAAADQAAIDSATPFDEDFDTIAPDLESKANVKVLRVSYAENVKTGKKTNQGTAFVVIPSVDANGDVKDETKSITFYLDADRKPIINNEYMPLMVYNSIVSAIAADPDTQSIDVAGTAVGAEGGEEQIPADATVDTTIETTVTDTPAEAPVTEDPLAAPAPAETPAEPMAGLEPDPEAPIDTTSTDVPADASANEPATDTLPAETPADTTQTDDLDNLDLDNIGGDNGDAPADSELDNFLANAEGDDTAAEDETSEIPAAEQETPAETAEKAEESLYPIELGLNTNDIKPISKGKFEEALKEMGIETSQVEADTDSVVIKFKNKAEVFALQDYFKDWKNYSRAEFCNFFPELKKCFDNKPSVPVAPASVSESAADNELKTLKKEIVAGLTKEGAKAFKKLEKLLKDGGEGDEAALKKEVKKDAKPEAVKALTSWVKKMKKAKPVSEGVSILGVTAINESQLYADSAKGTVNIVLPYNEDYAKMFGYANTKKKPSHINIVTESVEETEELYKKLSAYSANVGNKLDEDAKAFLERYADDFADVNESQVYSFTVPYNGTVEQKLITKGIQVGRVDEGLKISLHKDEIRKTQKLLEGLYGENTPVAVKDFFQFAEHTLNEGLKITIKDDHTGKTITLDTDDLEGKKKEDGDSSNADEQANFTDSFKGTTFNTENSALFNAEDGDSDEDEKNKEDNNDKSSDAEKNEEGTEEEVTPADQLSDVEETPEESGESEEKEEKPAKKKFIFRKKKSTSESVTPKDDKTSALNESTLNESATPNVLDYVKLKNGTTGQIIATLPMSGNLIVNVNGHTVEVGPKDVSLIGNKQDVVDCPFKYDEATLKGLYEHMVQCGMFMNGNQITPNNCYVKYKDFINAKEDEQIRLVIEGETAMVTKKYIQITEDLNSFALPKGYISAEEISDAGIKLRDILVNIDEFNAAGNPNDPISVMQKDELTGEYNSYNLPRNSIRVNMM